MDILNSVFGLLVALGLLVTVHEFGHFWVARRCGVKVLRFSVGFGPSIWSVKDKLGTEYSLSWIPLGGYVKMLDEREEPVPAEFLDQAFSQKTSTQKIAIALAGPVANFIFAFFAFTLMYMVGVRDLVPIVDAPIEATPAAAADLRRGDKILSVDGKMIESFSDLNLRVASRLGDSGIIKLTVDRESSIVTIELSIEDWLSNSASPDLLKNLGIYPQLPDYPAVIGRLDEDGAAFFGGLEVDDLILSANDVDLDNWLDWVRIVQESPNESINVTVRRGATLIDLTITPTLKDLRGQPIGYVGAATKAVDWREDQVITARYWPWHAASKSLHDTSRMIGLSYDMLWKMVTGHISLKQIGGPISMAQMAGVSVASGFESFVGFLALISISLGIVNLLPVPILDGGHVVMHTIELIIGRPLSESVQLMGMKIGMAFIILLMLMAFLNDLGRIL